MFSRAGAIDEFTLVLDTKVLKAIPTVVMSGLEEDPAVNMS